MIDDVITLAAENSPAYDSYGNEILTPSKRDVFCRVRSVSRSEFYQAAQTDLHPTYIFSISHYKDYAGEKLVKYTDWTGKEKTYTVIRAYRLPDSDVIELTAEERINNG